MRTKVRAYQQKLISNIMHSDKVEKEKPPFAIKEKKMGRRAVGGISGKSASELLLPSREASEEQRINGRALPGSSRK